MKALRFVLLAVLVILISCAGPIKIEKDGTMHGATYDIAMVEIIARANLLRAYAQNPAAFDYKCPFDPTDVRRTTRRISEARRYYNQLSTRQKSDFDRRANNLEQRILEAGRPRQKSVVEQRRRREYESQKRKLDQEFLEGRITLSRFYQRLNVLQKTYYDILTFNERADFNYRKY